MVISGTLSATIVVLFFNIVPERNIIIYLIVSFIVYLLVSVFVFSFTTRRFMHLLYSKNPFAAKKPKDDFQSLIDNGHLFFYRDTFHAIVAVLEARDSYTSHHSERVSLMAKRLCTVLKIPMLQAQMIELTAVLHDIGKIGIRDVTLHNPGKLSPEEWEEIKKHPQIGAEILAKTDANLTKVSDSIMAHHERWDGTGYPKGLKAEEIPYAARIIAICDSVDAMLSARVYRPAMNEGVCRSELEKGSGHQYQPELVDAFLSNWNEVISDLYLDDNNVIEGGAIVQAG